MYIYQIVLILMCVNILLGCGNARKAVVPTEEVEVKSAIPQFSADSAYNYVAQQVAFGYRVPGTVAHKATAKWLSSELQQRGAVVINQEAVVEAYDGTKLPICNIIAQFSPEKTTRVLLAAHWDSRPYADHDPDAAFHRQPIDGANDGASGVGVLLEIARCMQQQLPAVGVDIILFDAEDYGAPEWVAGDTSDSWALGSQYWSTHPHRPGYQARYGILLDMVGASGIGFYKEYFSQYYARHIVEKVWGCAARLGYESIFINLDGGAITDDHLNINRMGIPTIDIIQHDPMSSTGFFPQWHTREDNMQHIDAEMLGIVGEVVMNVVYEEK